MDLNVYANNIKSTGFILENDISELLSENKWNVINNKYYIDDVMKVAREIDIIAYKATKVEDIHIYTSLIISCKKNEEKVWALLSKEINKNDPNLDFEPLQNWTNHPIIKFEMDIANAEKSVVPEGELYDKLFKLDGHVFAFQEMFKKNGKPDNDKNIFSSITSLMKSQSYELASLPNRKKNRTIYFFYLLSIVDSQLVLLKCSKDGVCAEQVKSQIYISNYIIDGNSVSSKIKFLTVQGFIDLIDSYNELHEHNIDFIKTRFDGFYEKVLDNIEKSKILTNELVLKYGRRLTSLVYRNIGIMEDIKITGIWRYKDNIQVDIDTNNLEFIEKLNDNEIVKNEITHMIEDIFKIKIEKEVKFDFDIPF